MATHAPITGAPTRAPVVTVETLIAFCERHGMAPSRFGRDAVSDPRLVSDLRAGRALRETTASRIAAHLAKLEGR